MTAVSVQLCAGNMRCNTAVHAGHRLTGFQFSSVSYCHFSAIKKAGRSFFSLRKQAVL